jgi:SAM-dependent methyltransferase
MGDTAMQVDWNQRYVQSDTPWDSGVPSQNLKSFLDEGKIKPGRVLELGCGTGTNALFLAQLGFDVTAVDLSKVALERAREKATKAKVKINFVEADVTALPDLGGPFPFVFDRGTYHIVRKGNLSGLQTMLTNMVEPSGFYLVLAGNANTLDAPEQGPPTVRAGEIVSEIELNSFDLIELKQTLFHGIEIEGKEFTPLAWSALFQRRKRER